VIWFLLYGYLALGFYCALRYDEAEMRKHVPYADAPGILSLRQIRIAAICSITLIGLPFVPYGFVKAMQHRFRVLKRARRRFR
jgi:hypothetical protein